MTDTQEEVDFRPYPYEPGDPIEELGEFTVDVGDYISREFHEREVKGLWGKVWQMACRVNEIPEVGDYFEYEIVGRSVIIVRDTPDTIKAFRNTCRHRATALASGCGSTDCFVCPFHGWTYGLDGSLIGRPADRYFPHAPRPEYGLFPVNVDTFDGWVFINLDSAAPPLKEYLGEKFMRIFLADPSEGMRKAWHLGIVVQSNWKVMIEAFQEGYHIPTTHPTAISDCNDPYDHVETVLARQDIYGLHSRLGIDDAGTGFVEMVKELEKAGTDVSRMKLVCGGPDAGDGRSPGLLTVFPNLMYFQGQIDPNGNHIVYNFRPNGDDHNSCIYEIYNLVPVPPGEKLEKDVPLHMLEPGEMFTDQDVMESFKISYGVETGTPFSMLGFIQDQDVSNSALVQKGMRSRAGNEGNEFLDDFVLANRLEVQIVGFHRNIHRWLEAHNA